MQLNRNLASTRTVAQEHGGAVQMVKQVETNPTTTTYYLRSSLLGGRVITELNESGQKTRTFVYQGSEILAWQKKDGTTETLAWEHRDLSNASVRSGDRAAELEPMGMNGGVVNPFPAPPPRPSLEIARTYPGFAEMMWGNKCVVDGIDTPCRMKAPSLQLM